MPGAIGFGLTAMRRAGGAALFGPGRRGAWYDPSDIGSLAQDSAGIVPAAIGAPVGRIADVSGNGHHAVQPVAAKRPMLGSEGGRLYLAFDGLDDFLSAGDALDLGVDSLLGVAACRIDAGREGTVFAKSLSAGAVNRFALLRTGGQLATLYSPNASGAVVGGPDASGETRVVTSTIDRVAGVTATGVGRGMLGSAGFAPDAQVVRNADYRFLIGAYNNADDSGTAVHLAGRIYGLLIRLGPIEPGETARAQELMAIKSGVNL